MRWLAWRGHWRYREGLAHAGTLIDQATKRVLNICRSAFIKIGQGVFRPDSEAGSLAIGPAVHEIRICVRHRLPIDEHGIAAESNSGERRSCQYWEVRNREVEKSSVRGCRNTGLGH